MAVQIVVPGTPRSLLYDLTTNAVTDVLEHAGRSRKAVYAFHVVDDSGSGSIITLNAVISGSTYALETSRSVTSNNTVSIELAGVVELLSDGDKITAQATDANRLHLIVFYNEYSGNEASG